MANTRYEADVEQINKLVKTLTQSNHTVYKIEILDWKECGEFSGDDVRPIFKITSDCSNT